MIIYFTGTGNSLVTARRLAEKLDEQVISMYDAVEKDLSAEKRIGLVFPTYMLDAPIAVRNLVPKLKLPKDTYIFVVITCGAQTNNAIWTVRKILKAQGVDIAYCNKIRFPDTAGLAYHRNPNDQVWKLERYASRFDALAADIVAGKRGLHYGGMDPLGCLMHIPALADKFTRPFIPATNTEKCIGCGICQKICPQRNIKIEEKHAVVGDQCTLCLCCVHFCPHQALELGGKPTLKSYQYHHPDIKVQDLYRARS